MKFAFYVDDVVFREVVETDFAKLRRFIENWAFIKNHRKAREDVRLFHLWHSKFQNNLASLRKSLDACLKKRASISQYLANLKKTVAGLIRMAVMHNMAKHAVCPQTVAAYRVRQITVTHPIVAPPEAA